MAASIDQLLADSVAGLAAVATRMETAAVTSIDPLTVQGSDGDLKLPALASYEPRIGDIVQILRWGTSGLILGAPKSGYAPSASGIILAGVHNGLATVAVDGVSYQLPVVAGASLVAGGRVGVVWSRTGQNLWQGFIVGPISADTAQIGVAGEGAVPAGPPVTEPASPPAQATVRAVRDGCWRGATGGWRSDRTDLAVGAWKSWANHAWWFYGTGFAPYRGRTVVQAHIWLHALAGGAASATSVPLVTHGQASRGSGEPAILARIPDPPALADHQKGWFPISAGIGQALVDGQAGGVGAVSDRQADYGLLASLASDPLSGSVRLAFKP